MGVMSSLPFFMVINLIVALGYLALRKKMVNRQGSSTVTLAGLFTLIFMSGALVLLLPAGSYMVSLLVTAVTSAHLLPSKFKIARFIPIAMAIVLFTPNIILIFIGSGLKALVLATILVALLTELWSESFADLHT